MLQFTCVTLSYSYSINIFYVAAIKILHYPTLISVSLRIILIWLQAKISHMSSGCHIQDQEHVADVLFSKSTELLN